MKNYLTVWTRWARAKAAILAEHQRIAPLISVIRDEITALSGQMVESVALDIPGLPILFYPLWQGFAYTYSPGWDAVPQTHTHWNWSLREAEAVASWMRSLQEEEIKILFRQWADKCNPEG